MYYIFTNSYIRFFQISMLKKVHNQWKMSLLGGGVCKKNLQPSKDENKANLSHKILVIIQVFFKESDDD